MIDIGADLQRAFDEGYEKGKADRPQGEWTKAYDGIDGHVKCTNCFKTYDWDTQAQYYNFCPNCGARMITKDKPINGVLFKGRLEEGKYNLIKTTDGWVLDGENIAYAGFDIYR